MTSPQSPREPTMEEILASIRRIIAEEEQGTASQAPAPPASAKAEKAGGAAAPHDILELTDLIEDETAGRAAGAAPPAADGEPPPLSLSESLEPEPMSRRGRDAEPGLEAEPLSAVISTSTRIALPPPAEVEGPLLTLAAEEIVSGSMREVAEAVRSEKPAPPSPGSTPLEALVLEALRPALKSWIDQNLPDMVERLVRDELRRLARRVEDE